MSARIFTLLFAWLLGLPCLAQEGMDFEYGPRPPLFVFDPGGLLEPEAVKEISDPLATLFQQEGIDVIVVVLGDLGKAPPDHVARQFAGAWCKSAFHCVVLHVPGREGSPWLVPSGKLTEMINREQIDHALEGARRRASSEPKDSDKVRAAATEAADLLRYWTANAINHSEMIQAETTRMRLELETKSRQSKIVLLAVAAAILPLVGGLWLLVTFLRNRGPAYFPQPLHQPRLGAPHAGGNHAVVDLGSPIP